MTRARKNIMLGTAGHVDHGKTALVKLLTGCETDTLAEEKQRGLTIDLGFAPCQLADERVVGIVDVPGHVDFIRNMVAGAHGIDVVILVVAADDGIMPQTHEHLHILTLMGLKHGVVALTKVDLVDRNRRAEVEDDLRQLLAGTFLEDALICPVSNLTGEGFDRFFDTLNEVAALCEDRSCGGAFRLWVEDVFTIKGAGTVITGIPSAGVVRPGDPVVLLPGGARGRVRRMQVYGDDATEGRAGECVALNVPELEHGAIGRGMLLCEPDIFTPVMMAEADLHLLPNIKDTLPDYVEAQLHVGTAAVATHVAMLEKVQMRAGEQQLVQFRMQEALAVAPGERFVLRANVGSDHSGLTSIGGGRILGCSNVRLRRHKQWTLQTLRTRGEALDDPERWVELLVQQANGPVMEAELKHESLSTRAQLTTILQTLADRGAILRLPSGAWVHSEIVKQTAKTILRFAADLRQKNSQRTGFTPEELCVPGRGNAELVRVALNALLEHGQLVQRGAVLAEPGWAPQLTKGEQGEREAVARAFLEAGWISPAPADLGPKLHLSSVQLSQAIQALIESGELVRLEERVILHRDSVERGRETALQLFAKRPIFTTMEFRDALGVSRKYAVPLLDYFDRTRFTVRSGHDRRPGVEARKRLPAPQQSLPV